MAEFKFSFPEPPEGDSGRGNGEKVDAMVEFCMTPVRATIAGYKMSNEDRDHLETVFLPNMRRDMYVQHRKAAMNEMLIHEDDFTEAGLPKRIEDDRPGLFREVARNNGSYSFDEMVEKKREWGLIKLPPKPESSSDE